MESFFIDFGISLSCKQENQKSYMHSALTETGLCTPIFWGERRRKEKEEVCQEEVGTKLYQFKPGRF